MARSPLLGAIIDEVDQALASLQTVRRFLRELDREPPSQRRDDLTLRDEPRPSPEPSLRYSGMTVSEAAVILDMSEDHVRKLLRAGELLGAPYGGRIGWRLDTTYVNAVAQQRKSTREGQERARLQPQPKRHPGRPRKPRS